MIRCGLFSPADSAKRPCEAFIATVRTMRRFAETAAIDPNGFKRIPDGAHGLWCISQPSRYWQYVEDAVRTSDQGRKQLDEGLREFEKETGISVPREILPAFNGTIWMAAY